ncbi:MAG: glycosyltransferase family 2 protein [Methanomassiliicoccales archaeon]|jgi:glycosyltransferase involved in cell wall biosynthesis
MLDSQGNGVYYRRHWSEAAEVEDDSWTEEGVTFGWGDIHPDDRPRISEGHPRTSVVIPAFNEELTIGSVVLGAKLISEQVIVVDDGSTDKTAAIAELAGAKVLRLEKNSGKANALMRGLRMQENANCDVVVLMDGDGQHRPEDIVSVIAPVMAGEADLVIGSRFLSNGNHVPKYRRFGQSILNSMTNLGAKVQVSDTQSGLRALSHKAIINLDFASEGYNIESDMIVHFADRGLRIKEAPISIRYDVPNGHKKGSISMGIGLASNLVSTIGYKRPLVVFGIPGVILILAGILVGIGTMLNVHLFSTWTFQLLTGASMLAIGGFMFVSALILNSLSLLKTSMKRMRI